MKNRIYYFSATGNTLTIAKRFAEGVGLSETELISISNLDRMESVDFSDCDTVGIFSPVHCFGLPVIVRNFIKRILPNSKPYVYCCTTCSGMKGSSSSLFHDLLQSKGISLANEFSVIMPSNYIMRATPLSISQQNKIFEKAYSDIRYFIQQVNERKTVAHFHIYPFDDIAEEVAEKAVDYIQDSNYDRYFWLTDQCDSCGVCQAICPNFNIILKNGIPTWRGNCIQCTACIQWCPKEAIQFRKITLQKKRYHHPDVSISDMIIDILHEKK